MGILMNVGQPIFYTQLCQFLNWWYTANPSVIHRTVGGDITQTAAWNTGTYFDPTTGELKNPVPSDVVSYETALYAIPQQSYVMGLGANYNGEAFTIEFDGAAGVTVTGASSQTTVTANKTTWVATGALMSLLFTITDHANPPRNIRVYQSRYASNVANGEVWNPDWIALSGQWDVIRMLDFQQTNNSHQTEYAQLAGFAYNRLGTFFGPYYTQYTAPITNCDVGPKGSCHPEVLCSLVNVTGKPMHLHLPLHASDDYVTQFATYMRDHTSVKITYELSNEMWNFGFFTYAECFALGNAIWPGDAARAFKYAGYRAAQVMKIIRDVYGTGNRSRWRGAFATMNANPSVFDANLVGANTYLTTVGLTVANCFDALYGTGYMGDGVGSDGISSVIRGSSTQLKFGVDPAWTLRPLDGAVTVGHTYSAYMFFSAGSGWSDLTGIHNVVYTDANTLTWAYDSSARAAPTVGDNLSYVNSSMWFDLIAQSKALHTSTPSRYPDNYQYFNEQLRDALLSGTNTFGSLVGESLSTQMTHWAALKTRATANGLTLEMYEGGLSWCGDTLLQAFGGNPDITDFGMHFARSREGAEAVGAMYQAFLNAGGAKAGKYNQEGTVSQYGPWPMVDFGKTASNGGVMDTANAMVIVSQVANNNKRRFKLKTA